MNDIAKPPSVSVERSFVVKCLCKVALLGASLLLYDGDKTDMPIGTLMAWGVMLFLIISTALEAIYKLVSLKRDIDLIIINIASSVTAAIATALVLLGVSVQVGFSVTQIFLVVLSLPYPLCLIYIVATRIRAVK